MSKLSNGFTLIELLVVVAVISILSTGLMVAINPISKIKKARDAQRLSLTAQIRLALSSYRILNGNFPPPNSGGNSTCTSPCGGWEVAGCGISFIKTLQDSGDLKTNITDPSINASDPFGGTSVCYNLNYYRYVAGSYGCPSARGTFYVLGIREMETTARPHPQSPGWSCSGRNWQNEYDWVTGEFQL
ncbi:MAG: type II secretion system protein [Candidatus Gottesmanbacteria bacterium]